MPFIFIISPTIYNNKMVRSSIRIYTLNFNILNHLFVTYGYITYATYMRTGTDYMTTFTLRANKLILTCLDFKDNTIIFVAYSGAFLFTDAESLV